MINFNGCDRREFHTGLPGTRITLTVISRVLRSRREVSQQFPPATLTGSDERGTVRLWSRTSTKPGGPQSRPSAGSLQLLQRRFIRSGSIAQIGRDVT